MKHLALIISFVFIISCKNTSILHLPNSKKLNQVEFTTLTNHYKLTLDNKVCSLHTPNLTRCKLNKLNEWLSQLDEISFLPKDEVQSESISDKKQNFIKISYDNKKVLLQFYILKNNCYVIVKENEPTKTGYISNDHCTLLQVKYYDFQESSILSQKKYKNIFYEINDKKIRLNEEQQSHVLETLSDNKLLQDLYVGKVDEGISKKFNLQVNRNNNILGKFHFVSNQDTETLVFGRQHEGSPKINIGHNEDLWVREYQIKSWPRLYKLVKSLN